MVLQKSHFGGLNRRFKPNMRKNSYIFRSVYQIDMKFDRPLQPATETSWVVSCGGKTILRWRIGSNGRSLFHRRNTFEGPVYNSA